MKFYILIFSISIHLYKSQLCEVIKSCYNCSISKYDCIWNNNLCVSNKSNNSYINKSFLSFPFITSQYNCIDNEKDIEFYDDINNKTILFDINESKDDKINYHIYCFRFLLIQNTSLKINYNEKYKNNILEISIYDNITNSDTIINLNDNNTINIESNYFCLKITYLSKNKEIDNIISFYVFKKNKQIKGDLINIFSLLILLFFLFLTFFLLSVFIIWHINKSNKKKKEIIISSKSKVRKKNISFSKDKSIDSKFSKDEENNEQSECDESNCSELQEKYFQLSKDNFVENNYETIESFVHNLPDIEKKNIYLKAIIKTIPYFIVNKNNSEFLGIFCYFCESKIKMNDKICFINCGHLFHYDCIYQQIITNEEYKCIICKENITI